MKIGILHLTDIHLTANDNWIEDKLPKIISAIKTDFEDVRKIYIAITGDLVHSSTIEEYDKFSTFLSKIKSYLKVIYSEIQSKYIIIPGNHDCNFSYDSQLRRNTIKSIDYDSIGNDNSVFETCLVVQNNFWKFYHDINGNTPDSKIFYQINLF